MSEPIAPTRKNRRWPRRVAGAGAAVVALGGAFLAWLGAFGGPLYVDVPATGVAARPDVAAVIFSGDLGFRIGMSPHVAARLARSGIPVTGVNSLVYFRTRRTPQEVRGYVEAAMAHARRVTGARWLILIGQSYGADMLHVGLATLPPADRRDIALVALIVPTDTVYFRISPAEYFAWSAPDAAASPTARALDWVPLLCVRGIEETDSLCPMLTQRNAEQVALPGGHPLRRDDAALAGALLRKIGATIR